jgi:ribosomal protein L30E
MGFIYFIVDTDKNQVKIGYSKYPTNRLKQLATATSSNLVLAATIPGDRKSEVQYHRHFAMYKCRREWFELSPEIQEFINRKSKC